jgi:valyl-tRNA synthetase
MPDRPCACGSTSFTPEEDVMDTWATSSMSPQIVGRWLREPELYRQVFPFALRPQGHEIIRTWAFYTIVKSLHHFGTLPWQEVAISGWGLLPEGMGKISKSRGGGPISPVEIITKYSADAVRYWAASTGYGKDATISEEKIATGAKLVTKLWNVAKFSQRFLEGYRLPAQLPEFTPTDKWLLSRMQRLTGRVSEHFRSYDYAAAKSETESFFWRDLADNYLEMSKERLYDEAHPLREGARYTLYTVLLTTLKLFAPFLPYVTEEIYQALFKNTEGATSLHIAAWPTVNEALLDEKAEMAGESLIEVATTVRRYKSESNLSLGAELRRLQLATSEPELAEVLRAAIPDIKSVTRASDIEVADRLDADLEIVKADGAIRVALAR